MPGGDRRPRGACVVMGASELRCVALLAAVALRASRPMTPPSTSEVIAAASRFEEYLRGEVRS